VPALAIYSATAVFFFGGRYEISYGFELTVVITADHVQVHGTTEVLDSERLEPPRREQLVRIASLRETIDS